MGLSAALQIGTSALNASQLAIQVTGNNLANAATPGYSRQLAMLAPTRANIFGRVTIGTGVGVSEVRRQVDVALQARLWGGVSEQAASAQDHSVLSQIEDTLGELGNNDLSSQLSAFFNTWSERANGNSSSAVVIQQGQTLADFIKRLRSDLSQQRDSIDTQLAVRVGKANGLLEQIANVNRSISDAEAGGGTASTLRDQRDSMVTELSQYMDVSTVEQANGAIDVLIGSTPLVQGAHSRGIEFSKRSENGEVLARVSVKEDGQELAIRSGEIGSMLANRGATVNGVVGKLDSLASQLIFQVNRLHSTGSNAAGLTSTMGTLAMTGPDTVRALNDPANTTMAGLPFQPVNGGFTIRVQGPGGATQSVRINVDLDGRDNTGAVGYADDTSLDDIRAALDAVGGISASITGDGQLKIDADAGYSFAFTEDSSSALAALGVNSYFSGTNGSDIGVTQALKDNPTLLAAGRYDASGVFSDNGTAMQINGLQDLSLGALGGVSISQHWQDAVQQIGVQTSAAASQADAATVVRDSLQAQREAVSGVSIDEESVNLLTYQRQYQGAAKYISTVDSMMQTLIELV